ncbi:FHA domain-containing protein [bacterium]|nr:FHA domain-containing protein [bacterium]
MSNLPGYLLLSLRFILALLLYAFLAFSVWTIWKDLRKTAASLQTQHTPPIYIEIEHEKNKLTYNNSEIIIGRAPVCDLHIMDETVSSKHGQMYYRYNQWWYEDLGSSNGSFLNQLPVKTATVLTDGDELRIGKINLLINLKE